MNADPKKLDLASRAPSFFKELKKPQNIICTEKHSEPGLYLPGPVCFSGFKTEKVVRIVCPWLPGRVLIFTSLVVIF